MSRPTLNIDIEPSSVGFIFCDNTSKFSKQNPNGWKPGEFSITNVTDAYLNFYLPNTENPIKVIVKDNLPSTKCFCVDISDCDLDLDKIPSGKWKVEYNVIAPNFALQKNIHFYDLRDLRNELDHKKRAICDINSEEAQRIFRLNILLQDVENAICCGMEKEAGKIIEYLQSELNCKCC